MHKGKLYVGKDYFSRTILLYLEYKKKKGRKEKNLNYAQQFILAASEDPTYGDIFYSSNGIVQRTNTVEFTEAITFRQKI